MYQNKYDEKKPDTVLKKRPKLAALILSLLVLVVFITGTTTAYLVSKPEPVINSMTPAKVSCQVTESFNGTTKRNVNVTNTGDIPAYIRVKLISYRVNGDGKQIGGLAPVPDFTPGKNWVEHEGFYYYTLPVDPGKQPADPDDQTVAYHLIDSITLTGSYDDADGGKQVIEVMAEAIQALGKGSSGKTPTQLAWGVTISKGSVAAYKG